jgi:hypothetical protein
MNYLALSVVRVDFNFSGLSNYVVFLRSVIRLLVTANVVPISPILGAIKMNMLLRNVGSYKNNTT